MRIDPWWILRIGIVLVLFWFGINQVIDPSKWVFFIPDWVINNSPISPELIIVLNGGVELVLGTFILLGIFLRISAFIIALHLFSIAASLGNTPSGIRDVGLAFMALALVFKK